ncbi:MAG: energy-coupling factor ABC transporter permease [Archaeoglobaceae archaeon]
MHIPDGYLDPSIAATFYILSMAVIAYSIRKTKVLPQHFGVVAAAIFAAQMLNWPIPGGTSAHFVGGALAGILLGPYAGCLAMSVVLIVQCLVFADGGITALGANIWNMAVVNVFVGYGIFKALEKYRSAAAFLAGWLGITLAAVFAGLEVGLSKHFIYGMEVAVPVMGFWHALLGVVEGVVTAAVVSVARVEAEAAVSKKPLAVIAAMIIVSPLFAYAAELVGYTEPLERAAEELGLEEGSIYPGLIPDYEIPGLGYASSLVSGAVGILIVLALAYLLNARAARKNA